MKKLISKLISKIKKENYKIDDAISSIDLLGVLFDRFKQVIRGFIQKIFIKTRGILFIGKHVKILGKRNIKFGSGVTIDDGCFINALCKGGMTFGNNVSIGKNSIIECTGVIRELGEELIIEDNVGIAANAFISMRGKIVIGKNTIMGPGVSIHAENHIFSNINVPIRKQGADKKGIIIGEDCWIGAKAVILDGVKLGKGVIVAAGAVVTGDIEDYKIVGGIPAKVIKDRRD